MGDFKDAVTTLLDAFSSGIAVIKSLRRRRAEHKIPVDPSVKAEETRLSKSLRKNRADVRSAYSQDFEKLGSWFAAGDVKAHSTLTSILCRLNAGFVNIIDSFTQGKNTQSDCQALLEISNSSRAEALRTFEQLSMRLSTSSLHSNQRLVPRPGVSHQGHKRRGQQARQEASDSSKRALSKASPEPSIAITPLGPATPEGWVRSKAKRKTSSTSTKSKAARTSRPLREAQPEVRKEAPKDKGILRPIQSKLKLPIHTDTPRRSENRMSLMSFASDSTKVGEIPEHKWAKQSRFAADGTSFPVMAAFPLEPYTEPEKARSRFMRLFRR